MLAAKLGSYGYGSGFGRFLYQVKPVRLPLNKKTVGVSPPVEFLCLLRYKFASGEAQVEESFVLFQGNRRGV